MSNHDFLVVYSLALMNRIVQAGYDCKQVEDDFRNPKYKVFLFENKPEIKAIMDEYMDSRIRR